MPDRDIPIPSPARQLAFHALLTLARKEWLSDALVEALGEVDPATLMDQLAIYVPPDAHVILASAGIPDEYVFPVPVLLEIKPTLVGYYRLLLGLPQKTFYGTGTQMGMFKSMEENGTINNRQRAGLPAFCQAMRAALAELVRFISPTITPRDVAELPILTLGQQFQGGNNNTIGKKATAGVFLAIRDILRPYTAEASDAHLDVRNPAGREFIISLAGDPDVRIQEKIEKTLHNRVAIEIKGGADRSNQHNRIGEAEKSHQKAKEQGFQDFWTIIHTKTLDLATARVESPTTRLWFDTAQVLAKEGPDWNEFREHLLRAIGIHSTVDSRKTS